MNAEIWAQIKRLHEGEGYSISEIARRVRVDRKTVRLALAAEGVPVRKAGAPRTSKLEPYKDHMALRLKEYPELAGTLLFEEIKRLGYAGKESILWEYLRKIRPKSKEAFLRIETLPGEFGQVDWANCSSVRIGNAVRKLSCFVMVLSYSRMMYLEFTLSQGLEDFLQCHANAFRFFGGVPKKILYDNLKTVVLSRLGNAIQFNPKFMEFTGVYLFEPVPCNIARGNEKGKVESGIGYIRKSFLAGRSVLWPDIQRQAALWRDQTANVRIHGTTRERPLDRLQKEALQLQGLPAREYDVAIPRPLKATSQALVHFDGNTYSVPYSFAYRPVWLKAYKDEIRLFDPAAAGRLLAVHKRSFERGLAIEDPKHYEGLIAEKKKAFASKLKDRFLSLGELAKAYLDGLISAELHIHHHVAQIMDCSRLYGKTEVLQAMDHALRHKAYGAPYLKNIILQQRAARGVKENVPITIPTKPAWTELAVEEQDLGLYDDLFEDKNDSAKS